MSDPLPTRTYLTLAEGKILDEKRKKLEKKLKIRSWKQDRNTVLLLVPCLTAVLESLPGKRVQN